MKHKTKVRSTLFTRNFTLLVLGQVSSLLGNYTLKFALSMYVLERTGSASVFAGLLAAAMVPTILLSPVGGVLADRADRRRIMVTLDVLSGLAVLAAAAAMQAADHIAVIAALLFVLSILGAFESPTVQACVPQMLSDDDLLKGNAVVGQVQAVAGLVTPFLGSVFYAAFGLGPVFAAAVVCFFVTAGFECLLRLDPPERRAGGGKSAAAILRADLAESLRFLRRDQPAVCKLLLLAALVSMVLVSLASVGFPYLVRTVLGLSARLYGAAESAMGVAAIAGSAAVGLLAGRLRPSRMHWLVAAAGLCLLPVSVMGRYLVLLAAFCGCQLAAGMFSICAVSLVQQRTPRHLTGKVMAFVYTIPLCAQPVGQLLCGALLDAFVGNVWLVLLPGGLLICTAGLASAKLFAGMERDQPPKPQGT
ncbi:MAG TPA: MFS transporter [Candidatus Gemmiger faecigallinarum]|nr:MFS transporter [Candidatus Gemmiger faecigallinarum]